MRKTYLICYAIAILLVSYNICINVLSFHELRKQITRRMESYREKTCHDSFKVKNTHNDDEHDDTVSQKDDNVTKNLLHNVKSNERKKKAVTTLSLIALFQFLCMVPFYTYDYYVRFVVPPKRMTIPDSILHFELFKLLLLSGGINSLIYIIRTKKIRKFYAQSVLCCISGKEIKRLDTANISLIQYSQNGTK